MTALTWRVEFAPTALRNQRDIFRYLFYAHHNTFGHASNDARTRATKRLMEITRNATRLEAAPHRGTRHVIGRREYRHVTIERAIYWFTLDEASETVRVVGIFHGAQDHLGRMLARLASEGRNDDG